MTLELVKQNQLKTCWKPKLTPSKCAEPKFLKGKRQIY